MSDRTAIVGPRTAIPLFGRPPETVDGVTIVFSTSRGARLAAGAAPTLGERMFGGFRYYREVDTSAHQLSFTCDLPTEKSALLFQAVVEARWRVADPFAHLDDAEADSAGVCRARLRQALGDRTRAFMPDQRNAAERDLRALVGRGFDAGHGLVVIVRDVSLSLPAGIAAEVTKIDGSGWIYGAEFVDQGVEDIRAAGELTRQNAIERAAYLRSQMDSLEEHEREVARREFLTPPPPPGSALPAGTRGGGAAVTGIESGTGRRLRRGIDAEADADGFEDGDEPLVLQEVDPSSTEFPRSRRDPSG